MRRAAGLGIALWLAGTAGLGAADDEPRRAGADDAVRLPTLAIGETYSTWRLAAAPARVRNDGDDTLRVRVAVVVPGRHEITPNVLPVPDRTWVRVETSSWVLPPRTACRVDVRLSLPYDPELAGHTYEVDLWSEAQGSAGTPRLRQRHRLLFHVEMDFRDDTEIDCARRSAGGPALL